MTERKDDSCGEVVLFQAPDGTVSLDVRLDRESLWLSLNRMAALFDRDKSVISRHLRNVFNDRELDRGAVVAENATTAADGKAYQVEFFNLDAISLDRKTRAMSQPASRPEDTRLPVRSGDETSRLGPLRRRLRASPA
jgi:hypothetical protein